MYAVDHFEPALFDKIRKSQNNDVWHFWPGENDWEGIKERNRKAKEKVSGPPDTRDVRNTVANTGLSLSCIFSGPLGAEADKESCGGLGIFIGDEEDVKTPERLEKASRDEKLNRNTSKHNKYHFKII